MSPKGIYLKSSTQYPLVIHYSCGVLWLDSLSDYFYLYFKSICAYFAIVCLRNFFEKGKKSYIYQDF